MRAVLYTGGKKPWAEVLGERPWALLPVGSRPLLSYWLELCVDLGITDVQIILGRDAEYIEMFCGNGERWGLTINYSLMRSEDDPQTYLSRDPGRWSNGLLYVGEALFPRRCEDFTTEKLPGLFKGCCICRDDRPALFVSRDPVQISRFIQKKDCDTMTADGLGLAGLDFTLIRDITHYYQLNMDIVRNEMSRYLSSGYSSTDGASIGYNVITPPSVTFTPPLAIGNDCRIGAISVIGSNAVISDHVLIDRQCEISDSIILSDTYVGRNLEIKGKIVSGNRIIDPEDGTCLEIEDPWLVAQTRPRNYMRDFMRAVFGWECALLLVVLQFLPFVFFYSLILLFQRGRFVGRNCWGIGGRNIKVLHFVSSTPSPCLLLMLFYGTSLDRFPQLLSVLSGKLWLCGHVPKAVNGSEFQKSNRYFPAVFSYSDAFIEIDKQMDALYYAHTRSLAADLRILRHALLHRLIEVETISGALIRKPFDRFPPYRSL
jgi:NDP-sugar pyrophosphorylase family protein